MTGKFLTRYLLPLAAWARFGSHWQWLVFADQVDFRLDQSAIPVRLILYSVSGPSQRCVPLATLSREKGEPGLLSDTLRPSCDLDCFGLSSECALRYLYCVSSAELGRLRQLAASEHHW